MITTLHINSINNSIHPSIHNTRKLIKISKNGKAKINSMENENNIIRKKLPR